MIEYVSTDVLVIGGGGAGARAALEAHDSGARVMIVMKGPLGRGGATAYSVSEIASFNVADGLVDPDDNPDEHFRDIIVAGRGMCDERLARILADEAHQSLAELEKWGVQFEREDGRYVEAQTCFHSRPRSHVLRGHAKPILSALIQELKHRRVDMIDGMFVLDLLVRGGRCVGAVALDRGNRMVLIRAKSVVLAAGGASSLFALNLNPPDVTGDGYALGYRAGAELVNLEFMQAGLGIVWPIHQLFSAWLWALYPKVRNGLGEEFVETSLPEGVSLEQCLEAKATHYPFSAIDAALWLDVAIVKELRAGRTSPHGGIFIDFTDIDETRLSRSPRARDAMQLLPLTRDWLKARKVDMSKEPIEVAWFSHAINGGLVTDENGDTSVPGLLAVGEVAGGAHGADRLGGNMMVACQVFGRRAGRRAALLARELPPVSGSAEDSAVLRQWEESLAPRDGDVAPADLKRSLQRLMSDNAIVVRSERSLVRALEGIRGIREEMPGRVSVRSAREAREKQELANLLQVGEMVVSAALLRRETRGSHYRVDFPQTDPDWDRSIISRLDGDKLEQYARKLPVL